MQAAPVIDPAPGAQAGSAPELFVVINPGSGAQDGDARRDTLARLFEAEGRRFRFIEVGGPGDLVEASERAASQAQREDGVIVAVGGDGTINTVAQAAWKAGCALGVLPQGTFNLFGRDHGIAQDLEQAAKALLRAQSRPVAVGEVNGRLFLVNASVGLYPQLLQDRETFKQQFGRHRWVAVLAGLATLFEWRRQLVLEFEREGRRTIVRTPTLFVGNNRLQLQRVGVADDVVARVGEGDLAAVIVRPIGTWRMVLLMVRGAIGRLGDAEQVDSFAFRSLTVKVLGMRKFKLAADGEVGVMASPLRFSVAARPLLLMVPREEDRVPVE
jgi:diacylglycerol kinase family enzyme